MAWNYERNESRSFKPIPEGNYRIRIKSAEQAVSKSSGNDMIALQFEVSGQRGLLFSYIVLNPNNREQTNKSLTRFFDSFKDIPDGSFDLDKWVGKVGACYVKHEEYNGEMRAKMYYYIHKDKQGDLPPWQEPPHADNAKQDSKQEFAPIPEDVDLPFV